MTSGREQRTDDASGGEVGGPARTARLAAAALVFGLVMAGATLPTALYGRY